MSILQTKIYIENFKGEFSGHFGLTSNLVRLNLAPVWINFRTCHDQLNIRIFKDIMCFLPLGSNLRAISDTFEAISPIDHPNVCKNHLCVKFRNLTCVCMAYSNIELNSGYPPLAPLRSVVEKVHIGVLVGFFNKEGFSDVPVHCESNPLPHRLGCKI